LPEIRGDEKNLRSWRIIEYPDTEEEGRGRKE
jgi:hypothetical protein